MPQFSYMPDQFSEKNEKGPKFDPFRVLPSQNVRTYLKSFILPNVFGYRLGIAKISLKNLTRF